LVRTSAFELEVLAVQKGLKLEVHVSSRAEGLTLTTDGTAVSQIVRNLLANAIKFTTMGSIHLTADVNEWIEISVVDTGSGMIPSLAANLFRPYSGTGAAESGSGLGLWISAELARSLGGKLEVESTQGVGTRVALRLPLGGAPPIL
jgi:signal transduction histidine kinase